MRGRRRAAAPWAWAGASAAPGTSWGARTAHGDRPGCCSEPLDAQGQELSGTGGGAAALHPTHPALFPPCLLQPSPSCFACSLDTFIEHLLCAADPARSQNPCCPCPRPHSLLSCPLFPPSSHGRATGDGQGVGPPLCGVRTPRPSARSRAWSGPVCAWSSDHPRQLG